MEHRWGRRIPLEIPVRLALGGGEFLPGRMLNVSISGAFVQTPRSMPPGTRLEVEVILRERPVGNHPDRVAAHVTRADSDGVAIEWCDLAPRSVRLLLQAQERHSSTG